ncbi:hypothetical protein NA655_08585 [Pseudomonas kuykendallii]|uniref:Uncharacterized protein n=1 Tax=Pseudomonas kuykendallii TaxID=1007099 RepID=A0A1H3EJJ6_9PSED|nr:hypothetical protein [Pseudomonas kuykendallii]MCQ4271076.1 hypothetical protein [Pseudomonas kuykendallii]SDX78765.1 hypothetical protein SAMN05216287_3746 [Pseudomonas kuykendallii]
MASQPESIGNAIAKERQDIFNALTQTHKLNELAVKRLQNKITQTLSQPGVPRLTKAFLNHELAYLFAYQRKLERAVSLVELALSDGLPETAVKLSKAHINWMNGRILMSKEILQTIEPNGERQMLSTLIGCSTSVGMIARAVSCLNDVGGEVRPEDRNIKAALSILQRQGFDDSQVSLRLQTAADIIRQSIGHPLLAYDLFATEEEGILFQFVVDGSVQDIVELDQKMTEALVDLYDDPIDSVFSVGIKPHVFTESNTSYGPYYASI